VADESGMMVSLIQSNYLGMGSGLVPTGLGFCFQNRGQLFSDVANVYEPGKRPFYTITKPDNPYLSFGVMGGSMQPQGQVQIIINLIDFGMDIQAAGDAARWYHFTDTDKFTGEVKTLQAGENPEPETGRLALESGLSSLKEGLEDRGHQIVSLNGLYGGYLGK